jgi:hypothetical protein
MTRGPVENPFTYGNPITDPRRFFGREREVEQVFQRLRNSEFESSSIVGDRRIGKTSLLNYLASAEARSAYGLDAPSDSFLYVDLQMVESHITPPQLWVWFLKKLADGNIDDGTRALITAQSANAPDPFALDDLFEKLDRQGRKVVFLLDEFDNITRNDNFGPDFYFGLRSLAIRHKLALITSSRRELIDLCQSDEIRSSPFFNIFANITLSLFSEPDTLRLIKTTLESSDIRFSQHETQIVIDVAGRHPLFLQMACHFLYEAYLMELDEATRVAFMSEELRREARPHLTSSWRNSIEREKIALTALALSERDNRQHRRFFRIEELRNLFAPFDLTLPSLKKRGLVLNLENSYGLASPIFTDWIMAEMKSEKQEELSYQQWIASREGIMSRLSTRTKEGLKDLLPWMSDSFRDLVTTWLADPKTAVSALLLLKSAFAPD